MAMVPIPLGFFFVQIFVQKCIPGTNEPIFYVPTVSIRENPPSKSKARVLTSACIVSYLPYANVPILPPFIPGCLTSFVCVAAAFVFFMSFRVHFTVTMAMNDLDAIDKGDGLYKYFKLESALSTTNMVLFDQDGQLIK